MTYRELYDYGRSGLKEAGVAECDLDARLLLEAVCDTDRNTLLAHPDRLITTYEKSRYREYLDKRKKRIPLQHILGHQEFMGLDFKVNEHVLIPRQDTEILVEEAMIATEDGMRVLDMCTGSGCIILSLMKYKNDLCGVGVDISDSALMVARENALRLGIDCTFVQGDLFEALAGAKFDIIVSNPPYIPTGTVATLESEVKDYEPMLALDGSVDGLEFYRRISKEAGAYLVRGGRLMYEIGYDQGEAVSKIMKDNGFTDIHIVKDYAGLDRVVHGRWL